MILLEQSGVTSSQVCVMYCISTQGYWITELPYIFKVENGDLVKITQFLAELKWIPKKSLHLCSTFREMLKISSKHTKKDFCLRKLVFRWNTKKKKTEQMKCFVTNGQPGRTPRQRHKNGNVPARTGRMKTPPRPVIFRDVILMHSRNLEFNNQNPRF